MSQVVIGVVGLAFAVLTPFVIKLVTKGVKYFETRTGIDLDTATEQAVVNAVAAGIGLAEQKAKQMATKGGEMDSQAKLSEALKTAANDLIKRGINVGKEELTERIESRLGLTSILTAKSAVAALGSKLEG